MKRSKRSKFLTDASPIYIGGCMPYIKEEKREQFEPLVKEIIELLKKDRENLAGNMNYLIYRIVRGVDPKRYKDWNEIIGFLECCKMEIYRRLISLYEDKKIEENGDI